MSSAQALALRVRPLQASHLCFQVDGIVEQLNVQLGAPAAAFDFAAFYAILGSVPTISGDPSRLLYDFLAIQAAVNPFTVAALRSEPRKAALNKAINARQNAYYAKYANAPASRMNQYFLPSIIGSKPQRLEVLSGIAQNQWDQLKAAYISDGRDGVVKTTGSVLNSRTESGGSSTQPGQSNESGQIAEENIDLPAVTGTVPPPAPNGAPFNWNSSGPVNVVIREDTSEQGVTSSGSSQNSGFASQYETIVNTDYGYRIPYLENAAQYERAQISLIDQQFAQLMYGQNLPNLAQVFQNELNSIDGDVFRLQIAFLNTVLMSPIDGIVTGIYKNPGDAVRASEPVIRVENNKTVYLVATLKYRGLISIGSTVTVQTTLFDSSGAATSVTGSVVAARGHRYEDDQWEVLVSCNNIDGKGNPIFPLGYHFDYDDTVVTIA